MSLRTIVIILALALPIIPFHGHAATTREIWVKVVDEGGRPIAGVHAVYTVEVSEGTFTGHGGRVSLQAVFETQTNAAGELVIPPQKVNLWHFWLSTNLEYPHLMLFKDGFEEVAALSTAGAFPTKKDVLDFGRGLHHTLTMKRAASKEAVWTSLYYVGSTLRDIYWNREDQPCEWKRVPRALIAFDAMHARVEPPPPAALITVTSPLRDLLEQDDFYRRIGCGSTIQFFAARR